MERLNSQLWGGLLVVGVVAAATVHLMMRVSMVESSDRPEVSGRIVDGHYCPMPEDAIGEFVSVPGGRFTMSAHGLYPEEGPPATVFVSPFRLQAHEVTNDQFRAFVEATGYVTEAEEGGGSARFVGTEGPDELWPGWRLDESASWRSPEGVGSDIEGRGSHPVVHVSLRDARRYAEWAGGRIPTEVEWEYAASLGLFDPAVPESGARGPNGEPRANIWDGTFPHVNTEDDGFAATAPVGCFDANRIGAYDMIGNVWEWTDTRFGEGTIRFTIKGGSYLCATNHCRRFRAAARQGMEVDFSTAHIGFRIIRDFEDEPTMAPTVPSQSEGAQ